MEKQDLTKEKTDLKTSSLEIGSVRQSDSAWAEAQRRAKVIQPLLNISKLTVKKDNQQQKILPYRNALYQDYWNALNFAELRNDKIHVNIWVRFLRSLFYELTIESRDYRDQECINEIWRYAGIKKPRNKVFELLENIERANIIKCAAYLLQDIPRKITSFMPSRKILNKIFIPDFIAKFFGKHEIYYDLFIKDEIYLDTMKKNNENVENFLPAVKLFVSIIRKIIDKQKNSLLIREINGAESSRNYQNKNKIYKNKVKFDKLLNI